MAEKTSRICPKCYTPGLIASDDPDQEGWGDTTEWHCPTCGYFAFSDFDLEQEESYEDDGEDWDED